MSDNTVRNNMGIAYNEAISISQDSNLTVFTETQISSHATFTNVFSRISVTGANDFQTVFHDVSLLPLTIAISSFQKLAISRQYSVLPS